MSTYTRTAYQVFEDAVVKQRVLNGIALLEKEHGPDWASKIDLETLDLSSPTSCVLGQLYDGATVEPDVIEHWRHTGRGHARLGYVDDEVPSFKRAKSWLDRQFGFERGLAILDGPLLDSDEAAARYGFDREYLSVGMLRNLTDEQLDDIGTTRAMLDAVLAEAEKTGNHYGPAVRYEDLDVEWYHQIEDRQRDA